MSKIPVLTSIRIVPRDTAFLDRRIGAIGEIFLDRTTNSLRVYNGQSQGGTSVAKADLTNVSNASFLAKATAAGVGGAGSTNASNLTSGTVPIGRLGSSGTPSSSTYLRGDNTWATVVGGDASDSFSTITVSGQDNVVASSATDTLTLVAGTGISITTNASTDSITITNTASAEGVASDSFSTIAVSGQGSVVADSATDTLTLIAGTGISITTNASTDSITITNSSLTFNQLTDAVGASTTIDKIYLPAITMLTVTNSGASAYLFDQYSGNNPTIYAVNGMTIAFNLQASGHPFLIQNGAGINYNVGLIHVATNGTVSTGASAQGKDSGTLYWKIPTDISGGYRYQCSLHAPMVGSITVKTFATL